MKLVKSALLLTTVSSIAACGGGGTSVKEAEKFVYNAAKYDTDSDGYLTTSEMKAGWSTMTTTEKATLASNLGVTTDVIDKWFNGEITFIDVLNENPDIKEALKGENGADGVDGIDGVDGKDGVDGVDGVDGIDGVDGVDGIDGVDGKNGVDGIDGVDGKDGVDGVDGVDGIDGVDGKDGVSITNVSVDSDGNVTVTLDNGTIIDAGKITIAEKEDPATFTFSNNHKINNEGRGDSWKDYSLTLDTIDYDGLNINGLKEAHNEGWTGWTSVISIIEVDENSKHAETVTDIAKAVAPGAAVYTYSTTNYYVDETDDVINHSYGIYTNRNENTKTDTVYTYCGVYSFNSCNGTQTKFEGNWSEQDVDYTSQETATVNYVAKILEDAPNALNVLAAANPSNTVDNAQIGSTITTTVNDGKEWLETTDGTYAYFYKQTVTSTQKLVDNSDVVWTGSWMTTASSTTLGAVYEESQKEDGLFDLSRMLIVGSTHNDTTLADYSASAGEEFKYHFIVADGSDFGDYDYSGTSFAAPRVTGAAALVMHKFNTNATNTKKILLETADDMGAKGVDSIYGHGLLNVEAALSPVGHLN